MSVAIRNFPWYSSNFNLAQPTYSIIIPAYNESRRIGGTLERVTEHLREQKWSAELLVVDDGSVDETTEIIERFATENPEVQLIRNPGNQGKGYSVRNGMLNARGKYLLFTDADLSSPIVEAHKLFAALESGADVAIGSRWMDRSLQFQRQPLMRRIYSRAFNLFLKIVMGLNFYDTQCGFKAFTREAAQAIFPLQCVHRWAFDVELIFLARKMGLKVTEVPVRWGHDDRSKMHPLRDGVRMGLEVLKVRWGSWMGKYSGNSAQRQ
ncbi:MAG TPA: dolichyl-phosphate beta-glucosyltransferase [Candidatus Angelobacter sp.]|nr:dolichyl-phosphate beta-glucosyltransferase [Candidatus Angelobacter sp.]